MSGKAWHMWGVAVIALFLIVALAAVASSGCGSAASAAPGTLKLSDADNGKTFSIKVGDTIEVVVAGNPTTGFSWASALAQKDAAVIQQAGEPVYVSGGTALGAGGSYTFTFKAVAKGQALIKLVYARSWESVPPAQTFTATVTVD